MLMDYGPRLQIKYQPELLGYFPLVASSNLTVNLSYTSQTPCIIHRHSDQWESYYQKMWQSSGNLVYGYSRLDDPRLEIEKFDAGLVDLEKTDTRSKPMRLRVRPTLSLIHLFAVNDSFDELIQLFSDDIRDDLSCVIIPYLKLLSEGFCWVDLCPLSTVQAYGKMKAEPPGCMPKLNLSPRAEILSAEDPRGLDPENLSLTERQKICELYADSLRSQLTDTSNFQLLCFKEHPFRFQITIAREKSIIAVDFARKTADSFSDLAGCVLTSDLLMESVMDYFLTNRSILLKLTNAQFKNILDGAT